MSPASDLKSRRAFGPGISGPTVKNAILAEGRRRAIVKAAVDVFYEKGYHVSRILDVAQAAGVSHGTVYNYVSCKEDLLYLICEEHFRGHEEIVERAVGQAKTPRQTLDALLRANIEVIAKDRKHFVVMLRELHHVERVKRRAFFELAAEQRKYIQKILREVSKDGRLIIENPLVTANILVYLPKLIISRGWDMRREVDQETINEALFSFMQRGLGLRAKSPRRRKANGFAKSRPGWAARGERMSRRW
jgi:AcrR family transcriptional regulator